MSRIIYSIILICFLITICSISLISLGYSAGVMTSGSMTSTINEGDVYLVDHTADYEEGDIVRYYRPSDKETVVHRLVEKTDKGWVTKGDNNVMTDQEAGYTHVTEYNIEGKVTDICSNNVW